MTHFDAIKQALSSKPNTPTGLVSMIEKMAAVLDRLQAHILDEARMNARRMTTFVENLRRGDIDHPPQQSADLARDVATFRTTREALENALDLAGGVSMVQAYRKAKAD